MGMYSAVILEHYRRPRNRGALESPDVSHEGVHALCGDRIRIELALRNGIVSAARFRGDACAIAVASASLLTGMIEGQGIPVAESFEEGRLLAALEAELPAARQGCARLPLDVLRDGLSEWRRLAAGGGRTAG